MHNRYRITLEDGYGREIDRLTVQAHNLRLAMLVSEAVLRGRRSGHGQEAASATIDLLGTYEEVATMPPGYRVMGDDGSAVLGVLEASPEPEPEGTVTCPRCQVVFAWAGEEPVDCLRCGYSLEESAVLHSVRTELHELGTVRGIDLDAVTRLDEFSRGLGEIDTTEED